MLLADCLNMTGADASLHANKASSETRSMILFLLTNIQEKNHKALIKYLESEGVLFLLRDDFELYKSMPPSELHSILKGAGAALTISALICIIFILQSLSNAEPVRLNIPVLRSVSDLRAKDHEVPNNDVEWIRGQIEKLTDSRLRIQASEWAEQNRYLPQSVTPMPGYYSYSVAPYLREIVDIFSADSQIREFDLMKGAQIGATVGVLENAIGYAIDHLKSVPMMLLTADAELAALRVNQYIIPMLAQSNLMHLVQSSDVKNNRKTGKTDKKIEFVGGGFLLPFGALSASKLRSVSIMWLLEDEIDAFPARVGKDGDPQKLAEARCKAYFESRKIGRLSTPLLKGSSRIHRGFLRGDQRYWNVPCKSCKKPQVLVFQGGNDSTEQSRYGLTWEYDENGSLDVKSVRYLCKYCGFAHRNSDKSWMLPRGEWIPTAQQTNPYHRSYHLSGLYSPVGMYPWEAVVADWLAAWDENNKVARDMNLLQEFYNNVLGEPFEIRGSKIRFSSVSAHRLRAYSSGVVPNNFSKTYCGSKIQFLTCLVDVHKKSLAVGVFGWARDAKCFVISYDKLEVMGDEADCSEISSPVWSQLRTIIEEQVWVADDGEEYQIAMTLIDAGFANDTVTHFCADYVANVYPILGRDRPAKNQQIKEFAEFKTQQGTIGYRIMVDHYKDRIAPVLRREWSEEKGAQMAYHFNAPVDLSDKAIRELTAESRREKTDDNGATSYYWHRPSGAANELWDLLVYGHAAVEIIAQTVCMKHFERESVDWAEFWDFVESERLFFNS